MALSLLPSTTGLTQTGVSSVPTAATAAVATPVTSQALGADRLSLSTPVVASTTGSPARSGTYTVVTGDTLSAIAERNLGDSTRWNEIFQLNSDQITHPDLIFPGQVLKLPTGPAAPTAPPTAGNATLGRMLPATPTRTTRPTTTRPDFSTLPAPTAATLPGIAMPAPAPQNTGIYWSNPANWPRPRPPVLQPRPDLTPDGVQPTGRQREQMLRQKLALLALQEKVVQMELELDQLIDRMPPPVAPPRRYLLSASQDKIGA
jgi:LysM repeat protein